MESPLDIITGRYGDIFLSKSENLKIVSGENPSGEPRLVTVYNAQVSVGTANPIVLAVTVEGMRHEEQVRMRDLDPISVHVTSYNSQADMDRAEVKLARTEPQTPVAGALRDAPDLEIKAIDQTSNSKVYQFEKPEYGRLTLFTRAPSISTGGNDLPYTTKFLPSINKLNFVWERNE